MVANTENTENTKNNNGHSSIELFKSYLAEKLQDKDAVIIPEHDAFCTTKHFFDAGII